MDRHKKIGTVQHNVFAQKAQVQKDMKKKNCPRGHDEESKLVNPENVVTSMIH